MKFSCFIVLLCLISFSCSHNSENGNKIQDDPYEAKIKIEHIFQFIGPRMLSLDSTVRKQDETLVLFGGTRQEMILGTGWIKVSSASAKNPESNRQDIPRKWKTPQGIYVGIPIDSLEAINGGPFYVQLIDNKLSLANWEGGNLSWKGIWVDFVVEHGGKPEPFMSSRDIIKNGWMVRCASFMYYDRVDNWNEPHQPCQGYPGDYPFLSFKEMTQAELNEYEAHNMRIMRNEVFARHGYIFKSNDLKEYFSAKAWYTPQFANVDDKLSELEKANVKLLQEREMRRRNSQLAKLIRKLPFLELPYDLNSAYPPPVPLDSMIGYPDETITHMRKAALTGLLPDTSKIFALVWIGTPPEEFTEENPGEMTSNDGGAMPAVSNEVAIYITTLDKNMNHIQTVIAKPYMSLMQEEATKSYCSLNETSSAILNRDWSYSSEYTAVRSCPTAGADLVMHYEAGYSGKVRKDGTIE